MPDDLPQPDLPSDQLSSLELNSGVVYSETIVHSAPARLASAVPYQLAMIDRQDGSRIMVRILAASPAEFVHIGDTVAMAGEVDGTSLYRRWTLRSGEET